MQAGSKPSSRAGWLTLPALLALVLTATALGQRSALTPVGRGTPGRVQITSSNVVGLYPGAQRTLMLSLRNLDMRHDVTVRAIRVSAIASTSLRCPAGPANLTIQQYGGQLVIPRGSARMITVLLGMPATVTNACQRATFKLSYSAQTWFK